jgi:N-acetylneuraminic acid mutarotase
VRLLPRTAGLAPTCSRRDIRRSQLGHAAASKRGLFEAPRNDRVTMVMRMALIVALLVSLVAGWFGCSGSRTDPNAAAGSGGGSAGATGGLSQSGGVGGQGADASSPGGSGESDGGAGSGGTSGMGGGNDGGDAGDAAPLTGFSWRALPSLGTKRQNAMGAAVGDTMYVVGGLNESGMLQEVEILGPEQTAWTPGPSLPNPLCCAAVGVLGGVIAIAGGYAADGQTATNALLLFDTATGAWQAGPPMPTARANAMGAVTNGKLAVIGGGTQTGATRDTGVIELYDPASNSWSSSTLAVTPRVAGVAVADSDGSIYVIGGAIQNSLYGDAIVEIVRPNGVTTGPSLSLSRVQVAGGLLPAGLMIAGGWTAASDTATAEGLVGSRAGWQSLPPMPTSRAGAASAVVKGSLIVAGGGQFRGAKWEQQNVVEALVAE